MDEYAVQKHRDLKNAADREHPKAVSVTLRSFLKSRVGYRVKF